MTGCLETESKYGVCLPIGIFAAGNQGIEGSQYELILTVTLADTAETWQILEQELLLWLHGIDMNEECLGVEGELAKVKIHLEAGCESFCIDHTAIRVDLCHTILTPAFTLLVAKRYRRPPAVCTSNKLVKAELV